MKNKTDKNYSYDHADKDLQRQKRIRRERQKAARTRFFVLFALFLVMAAIFFALFTTVLKKRVTEPFSDWFNTTLESIEHDQSAGAQNEGILPVTETDSLQAETGSTQPTAVSTEVSGKNETSTDTAGQRSESQSENVTGSRSDNPANPSGVQTVSIGETDRDALLTSLSAEQAAVYQQADLLAAGYDYDAAISMLQAVKDYSSIPAYTAAIEEYTSLKASCVAVDVYSVPHIFYHSLLNDTDRAFNTEVLGESGVNGFNAWMVTVEEFDKITQQLYDNGYVYVRLRDLVTATTDKNGKTTYTANTSLMLPPGKKAIVLSIDDLSYYHSYEKAGFPDKLVLDGEGKVKCQYTTADGEVLIGDYDTVPRLNAFFEAHPDASYHGARGMLAMTGYDGVFGYRTDADYVEKTDLSIEQRAWLENHPDFNIEKEIEQAKIIAQALKDEGWEFASHTWGHLSVASSSLERLTADNERWIKNVQNIVGKTDTIIFAHGTDIGSWQGYSDDNEKYRYYKGQGYDFYCNVDASVSSWVQITDNYVRQGRIDLDGSLLYRAVEGETHVLDSLFDAASVFDSRRPLPVIAVGMQ